MSFWDTAYRSGRVPRDPGEYDGHLPWVLRSAGVRPCSALDAGCGEGKSAVWLAARGFAVTGIDSSPAAIEQARRLAHSRGQEERARFHVGRFPDELPGEALETALAPEFKIEEMHLDVFAPGEPGSIPAWITLARPARQTQDTRCV